MTHTYPAPPRPSPHRLTHSMTPLSDQLHLLESTADTNCRATLHPQAMRHKHVIMIQPSHTSRLELKVHHCHPVAPMRPGRGTSPLPVAPARSGRGTSPLPVAPVRPGRGTSSLGIITHGQIITIFNKMYNLLNSELVSISCHYSV